MSRPLMAAVEAQQGVIDDQRRQIAIQGQQIALIARLAGVTNEVAAIGAKTADIANPAQPIPDPGEQGPSETTEQAATPETNDDVRAPGQTGNSTQGVPAASTDTALTPGGTLPAEPYGNLQDVTAPVSGTNTGEVGGDQTKIETDVRVGNPMVPDVAFPWTISDNQSNNNPPSNGEMSHTSTASPSRTHACLRLARLKVQAGTAKGDDLTLAAALEADTRLTDELINHEIGILSGVVRTTAKATPEAAAPRTVRSAARVAPSLASQSTATTPARQDVADSDIFL
ncbi:hypothetical protein OG497_37595 [Streptomyces sp. NBC_01242]|uniref:hypothetical protein n=1 Tax=Streptomyces sp. NBC_01242 TaxID=2903795 RepID=UPI00224D710F|nr:hypothetical protein [Streptomyces sp. NBC_01242]MCX4799572.1 hypothetical protein [Streptomyces sp. NBC_01242]